MLAWAACEIVECLMFLILILCFLICCVIKRFYWVDTVILSHLLFVTVLPCWHCLLLLYVSVMHETETRRVCPVWSVRPSDVSPYIISAQLLLARWSSLWSKYHATFLCTSRKSTHFWEFVCFVVHDHYMMRYLLWNTVKQTKNIIFWQFTCNSTYAASNAIITISVFSRLECWYAHRLFWYMCFSVNR